MITRTHLHSLLLSALSLFACAATQGQVQPAPALSFRPGTNGSFVFDTGHLRGVLRAGGKSAGLQSVTHIATGTRLDAGMGLMGHYRVFSTGKRYGGGAWDWPSTAKLTEQGAVEVRWEAADDRPFELRATYRWATPTALDVETTVTARADLPRFESFLASYFNPGFSNALAAAGTGYLTASRAEGDWQMFPRDDAAVGIVQDGRWKLPPNPVDWAIRPRLNKPVGVRRHRIKQVTVIMMGGREECFAVAMPYETEGHYSLYLSQFGRDLKAGESARARARLAVTMDGEEPSLRQAWTDFAGR